MICCICVTQAQEVLEIFGEVGEQLDIAGVMKEHFWFKPQPNDEICITCWDKIKDFHEFYHTTEKAHKNLHAFKSETILIKEEETTPIKKELLETSLASDEKSIQIEVEISPNRRLSSPQVEYILEKNPLDDDNEADECDSDNEYVDNTLPDYEASWSSSTSSNSEDEANLPTKKKQLLDGKEAKEAKVKRKRRLGKALVGKKPDEEDNTKKKRKRLDPKLTEEMIQKHIPMICNLCNFDCKTFIGVGNHFKEFHAKTKPYIMCCNKKFTRRHYIAQHALQHEDPNCFRCEACNKSFKTTYNLHTHNLSFHQQEENGVHACEFCPQKFPRRKLLEFHKPTHIPKDQWSFFCTKCPTPRPFASEYLLKTHESVHKRETNICHVCAKEIKDKYLFEKHVRLHFEDSGPRVKCPYPDCESWLKDEYNLKDHLRRHNSEGIIYKCPECEKICKNRKALSQHKRNNHSNKQYKCGQCGKTFKKAITLKEHTAHHTGESLYKCPFCPRTFNSNANMYSHKKKQHPVTERKCETAVNSNKSIIRKMLCCVCLLENSDTTEIHSEMGKQMKMADIIKQHLWFKPQPNDEMSSHICIVCWETILDFHEFYQQAEKIHAEFQISNKKRFDIKEEETPSVHNPIKLENDELYGDILQLEIEIDGKSKQKQPAKNEEIQKNPLDQLQKELECEIDADLESELQIPDIWQSNPLDDVNVHDINDEDHDMDTEIEGFSEDFEPSENSDEETSSDEEWTSKKAPEEANNTVSDCKVIKKRRKRKPKNDSEQNTDDVKKKRKVQYKFDYKHTEEMIKKHIPMGCNLCVFVGKTFSDIVDHFKVSHPKVRPYITCCDKKFTKRFYVAQHALKHEDPNCFKCNECNKSFTTTCGLRSHNLNYHAPDEERTYVCDLCPKKFARRNLLEMHKPSHIPKDQWQFFCTKCPSPKAFASVYLLNVHTSMQHKRAKHVCHVCAKEIRDKYSFEKHVRLHFEASGPRVPCPYPDCDSWLKDEDNLKQHLKRHNPEGVIYKCPECDKVVKNRRALTNHKRYSHSNETFQCEQCDKSFKKAISLREHMTQHTGETLYKCPFCPRTFNSNANMHAHKKRAHPIEWDEWRKNKTGSSQVLIKNLNAS
uniref:Transcription factor grauzone n=1 Tax=Stomoxys calcitrans TaxID=35570 RepID=A0A1I8NME2_STOCA|nr:unnamed protein product [Stomoxys calcitrans]